MTDKGRLIVALDVNTEDKALELVDKLKKDIKIFKIGSELFTSCGPRVVQKIKEMGCEVFLDLKFHDNMGYRKIFNGPRFLSVTLRKTASSRSGA